jgi:hypothetical protein
MLKRLTKRLALRERNSSSCAARVDSGRLLRSAARLMLASDLLSRQRPIVLSFNITVTDVDLLFDVHCFVM